MAHEPVHNLGTFAHPAKIAPNTTAPEGLNRVGPNGSFPVGDKEHDALAKAGAKTSERAGHITPAQAAKITAAANTDEAKHRTYSKPAGGSGAGMAQAFDASIARRKAKKGKGK